MCSEFPYEFIIQGAIMHFTGRTWRPPYEAHSVIIQATSGCTYHKCKFCSLYKNECFRMSPIEEFEEDLAEIKSYQPNARRIFWTGANPFAMSYENLKLRALTVRDYLIKCQTIAMFASIRDIKNKEVWQLRKLRAMGINGLSIGVESGDDETLSLANKGYTSADILEQCRKLDEAGIEYYFVYMTGLAGKGGGYRLTRTPEQYSVKCILKLTEESLSPVSCLEPGAPSCPRMADCRTLSMWKGLDQTISDYLSGITVADLIQTDPDAGSYVI